jgi:hypothetical protein
MGLIMGREEGNDNKSELVIRRVTQNSNNPYYKERYTFHQDQYISLKPGEVIEVNRDTLQLKNNDPDLRFLIAMKDRPQTEGSKDERNLVLIKNVAMKDFEIEYWQGNKNKKENASILKYNKFESTTGQEQRSKLFEIKIGNERFFVYKINRPNE